MPLVGRMLKAVFRGGAAKSGNLVATPIVAGMDELFAVDAEARRKALTTAARHIRRQESAKPLLDDIHSKIAAAQSMALPSSALSKACQYALTLWRNLHNFWNFQNLNRATTLRRTRCVPWLWVGRTGSTLAVPSQGLRLRRSFRSWKAAAG